MVVEDVGAGFYFQAVENESHLFADTLNYFNSKIVYLSHQAQQDVHQLFVLTTNQRGIIEREVLKNKLILSRLAPERAGYILGEQQGVIGSVAGNVLYLLKCQQVPVQARLSGQCWHELPVIYKNESRLLQPGTSILVEKGIQIDCDSIAPPSFLMGPDQWVSFVPHRVPVTAPALLAPKSVVEFPFRPLYSFGGGGLYGTSELRAAHKSFLDSQERGAISNIIGRRM